MSWINAKHLQYPVLDRWDEIVAIFIDKKRCDEYLEQHNKSWPVDELAPGEYVDFDTDISVRAE